MYINKRRFALNFITLSFLPLYATAESPWRVEKGAELTADADYRTGEEKDNPLWATGAGSHLITNPGLRFTTAAKSTHAAFITDRALLEVNNSTLAVQMEGSHAIAAVNSTVNVNAGNISTAAANSHGVKATDGSSIRLDNVDLSIGGMYGKGVELINSTLNADKLFIISSAASAVGIALNAGAEAETNDVSIALHSDTAGHGVSVTSSKLTGNGMTIKTAGKTMAAVSVDGTTDARSELTLTESKVFSVATGVLAQSGDVALTDVYVETSGENGHGLDINEGASVLLNGGSLQTDGVGAHGVRILSETAVLTAKGTHFETTGDSASAVQIDNGQAEINDANLTTHGDGSTAFYSSGKTSAERLAITTSGNGAHGVVAAANTLTLNSSTVNTTGEKATGLSVSNQGRLVANGVDVATSGAAAHSLNAQGGTLNLSNGTLTAAGDSAAGLYANGLSNSVALDKVALSSDASYGILSAAGKLDLALSNETTVSGGNGYALWAATVTDDSGVAQHAQVSVTGTDSVMLLGNVATDSYDNRIDLSLTKNSLLNGATRNVNQLTLDNTSRWLMASSSNLKTLKQDGSVIFNAEGDFKTLTVEGDLSGNGQFEMNTQLGDDSSPTDRLLVKGNAEGSFGVVINNKNGAGAKTESGIPVILVSGDAQSASFNQKNTVTAGNYEYFLNKVNDHDWYLQASYIPVPVEEEEEGDVKAPDEDKPAPVPDEDKPAPLPDEGGTSPTPAPDENKTYRAETAGYLMAPYLNAAYGFTTIGTYHERLGALQGSEAAWGRIYGRHDRLDAGRFGYEVNTSFIQLGGDLLHKELANDWQMKAGPMITLGEQRSTNRDSARLLRPGLSASTGKTVSTMMGAGAYLSAWNKDGTYLDTVAQITRYGNEYKSISDAKQTSYGVVLSGEVGKPFTLFDRFKLEPQAQLLGQYMNISQTYADGVKLNDQNVFIGQARGGLRLFWDAPDFVPYLQADVIQQLGATPGVRMNDERLRPDIQKGVWQAGVGLSGRITPALSVYAEAKYTHSFGQGLEGYLGNAGLKYQF